VCRIAVGPLGAFSRKHLKDAFSYLESSNGGDGNGVWINGKVAKGLKLSASKVARLVSRQRSTGMFVFHTRLRSTGRVHDDALHPVKAGDNEWLVQNGTWSTWKSYAGESGAETDTLLVGELVSKHGLGILKSPQLSSAGVFVHMSKDKTVTVVKRGGRPFVLHLFDDGRWLYASEDVGWAFEVPYTIIEVRDNTVFTIDKEGMPRESKIEPISIYDVVDYKSYVYSGTSYGGANYNKYDRPWTDDEWWDRYDQHQNRTNSEHVIVPFGGDGVGYTTLGSEEDGRFLARKLASLDSDERADFEAVIEEWTSWSEVYPNEQVDMCSICDFRDADCDRCPMRGTIDVIDAMMEDVR